MHSKLPSQVNCPGRRFHQTSLRVLLLQTRLNGLSPLALFIATEYRLISKKGEGTFSEVLKAQSTKTNKYVAIKCMKAHFYNIDQVRPTCSTCLLDFRNRSSQKPIAAVINCNFQIADYTASVVVAGQRWRSVSDEMTEYAYSSPFICSCLGQQSA